MTTEQAKKLYIEAGGPDDHDAATWEGIREEVTAIIEAKSDRAAGKLIEWWRC